MKQMSNDGTRVLEIGSDEWIIDNQVELKKTLLKLAKDGNPKPTDRVLLRALEMFTTK